MALPDGGFAASLAARSDGDSSMARLIDLYSDTQTRPSPGMRRAMAEAEVGDEQRGEDPTTRRLEERVAGLLGKEAAVFLPSGTMCNQIALLVHGRPGDELIAADLAHVLTSEAGGGSVFGGLQTWPIAAKRGVFAARDVAAAIRAPSRHSPRSRILALEQTVNRGGGAIWPIAAIEEVAAEGRRHGLAIHMDGARLLNAVVASGVSAARMAAPVDSLWLDLSKGLGCPVGGVLAGSRAFIEEAWGWKHRMGGALRQSGILAAAGLYALEHNVERLAEDHANARRLAALAGEVEGLAVVNPEVETNIVFLDPSRGGRAPRDVCAALAAAGVRMGTSFGGLIRAVTHLDVSAAEIETAGRVLGDVIKTR
jgi:threonine aldolase